MLAEWSGMVPSYTANLQFPSPCLGGGTPVSSPYTQLSLFHIFDIYE